MCVKFNVKEVFLYVSPVMMHIWDIIHLGQIMFMIFSFVLYVKMIRNVSNVSV